MEENSRKTLIYSVLGLVFLIVIMIGVTYSAFNYTKKGEKVNVIRTGQLSMTYKESATNIINIDNASPISDELGKELTGTDKMFTFEVGAEKMNIGSEEIIYYEITAEKLTEGEYASTLDNQYVRLYLEKSPTGDESANDYTEVLPPTSYTPIEEKDTLGAEAGEMVLYFDSFTNSDKATKYYKLRMWVSKDYALSDESKTFAVRVNVYASDTQVNKTSAITLNKNTTTLVKGTTETLTATVNSGAKNRKLIWASSDTSVATVTENGVVTAVAPGNANITVRALDEADETDTTETCQVTVTGAPANGITITETTANLIVGGDTQTLHEIVTPEDYANSGSITWESSDPSVATVDNNGVVTPLKAGSTEITATILGYTSNKCVVIVTKPVLSSITVSPKTATIERGKTTTLSATDGTGAVEVDWTTSDPSIATVDENGVVTGVGIGTATITATSTEKTNLTDTAEITVTKVSAKTVGLNTSAGIKVGASTTFIATLYDENNNEITSEDSLDVENNTITWSSDNSAVSGELTSCAGNISCKVTALSKGSATITVTVNSGATASQTLTVTETNLNDKIESFLTTSVNEVGGITRKSADGTIIETKNNVTWPSSATHTNYRYTTNGDNAVNNYVNFNCDLDGTNCELWRIVGSFSDIYSTGTASGPSGTKERRVKIMRATSIGSYSWDTSDSNTNSGNGYNKWEEGDLMHLLNGGYTTTYKGGLSTLTNNSLYWDNEDGKCFNGQKNATTECNFKTRTDGVHGLKTDTAKSMIGDTYWNLGGHAEYQTVLKTNNFLQNTLYGAERGNTKGASKGALFWIGKVALIYPSDYAYAGWNCNQNYAFYNKTNSDTRMCDTKNWMSVGSHPEWLLSPSSESVNYSWVVHSSGWVDPHDVPSILKVRPSVYLKSNVIVKEEGSCNIDGTTYARGSEQCPYNIQLGS